MPGPPRKPDDAVKPSTRKRRRMRDKAKARAAAQPAPEPAPDDIDTGGMGRVEIRREMARLLRNGCSSVVAAEEVCARFGIEERQALRYAAAVRKAWADLEAEERPAHRAVLLQVQLGVLVDARGGPGGDGKKDHKAANGAIRNLNDLLGLKVSKVELQDGGLDALVAALRATPAQREDEIAKLEAEARAAGIDPDAIGPGDGPG